MSSRSRGGSPAGVVRLGHQLRRPLTPAQLVERRVARDAEQPGALAAAPRVEALALAKRALERLRGDVLGGAAVAQQRRDVGEDVVTRVAVERLEVQREL